MWIQPLTNSPFVVTLSQMKNNSTYVRLGALSILFAGLISYGISGFLPFLNSLCVILSIVVLVFSAIYAKQTLFKEEPELKQDDTLHSILEEQAVVISQYEQMLDEQIVQLPCACGSKLFEGILIPNAENICECPKCENKYKVIISYDSIMITEPLDNAAIFEKMVDIQETETNKTLDHTDVV